jgi:peptide deformylase
MKKIPLLNKKELLAACLFSALVVAGILAIAGYYRINNNVLRIVEHPHPVLRAVAEPVPSIDESVNVLVNDMVATLRYKSLLDFIFNWSMPRGLAAPQVGVSKRLIVCGLQGKMEVMINPTILARKGTYLDTDDCMSVEEKSERLIKRSAYVKVTYKTPDNEEKTLVVKNDTAALVEHEIDHLNGVLNIDY